MDKFLNFCPFECINDIEAFIPQFYRIDKEVKPDYSWFNTAPRFSAFRVNTLTTSIEHVISLLESHFEEQNRKNGIKKPIVSQHDIFPDCIIINSLDDKSFEPDFERGEVVVDVACGCAVLRGAHIFAPGVLGLPYDLKEGNVASIYADLSGYCTKGLTKQYNNKKIYLGEGVIKMNRHKVFRTNSKPHGIAVEISKTISGLPSFVLPDDLGLLQNLPSILCSYVLDVKSSSHVLDMCAAPGNKTVHIANLMKNVGTIIALDKTPSKVEQIERMCKRFGIKNVKCFVTDSTTVAMAESDKYDEPPFKYSVFDRILLDVPCSALGQRPQLKNKISLTQLKSYPCLQKKLFQSAFKLLKPGGLIVYSTCTITTEENEDIVSWALRKYPELELCKVEPFLGHPGISKEGGLTGEEAELVQRFGPPITNDPERDTVGFFIAKLKKKDIIDLR